MRTSEEVWAELEADPVFVAALNAGIADMKAGRTVRWAEVKQRMETEKPDYEPVDESGNAPDLDEPEGEDVNEGPEVKNDEVPKVAIEDDNGGEG